MEKSLGKVFKVIREAKGLSQKEVAGGVISLAQLSRFERGVSGLTVDAFYSCLKNMNVPLDEFQYVYHNFTQTKDVLFSTELSEAYINKNIFKIKQILKDCIDLEKAFPDKRYYHLNTIVVRAVLFYCDDREKVSAKDIQFLVDYLFSVDEWGRYELWLFTNSVGLMTVASLETLASEMINRTQFYQDLPENRRRIIQMLLNVIDVCLEKGHYATALKFLNYVDKLKNTEIDLFETILIKYYRGLYAYQTGKVEGLDEMERCSNIMTYLECYGVAQQMSEKISQLKG